VEEYGLKDEKGRRGDRGGVAEGKRVLWFVVVCG